MEVRGKCRWKANQKTQKQLQEKQQQEEELQPQQTTQQLLQLAQRKCHQKQSERTNHLRLHKTQNQQQQQQQNPHYTRPKASIITQQQPKTLQHTYSTNGQQQQQQQQQKQKQKECLREPELSPIYHHRWPMPPLLLTHTPTNIRTPSAKPTRTSTNPNVVNKRGRFTAAATSCSIAVAAVTKAVTKTKTLSKIVCGCIKRLTWLWWLALLGAAQFTATAPTLAATSTAAAATGVLLAPKLLPHVMVTTTTSTSTATAVATAAAMLTHASAAHAAIIAADLSTATSSTIEPRLRRYKFPIGEADVAEMVVDPNADADADALVQVQVKRINLLDNEEDDDAASPPAPADDELEEAEEVVVPAQEALYADEDEDETETETEQLVQQASNRKLNSNEQQLLVFYRRVQHATEQEAQAHQKPQRQQSATHRNYERDDGGREILPNIRDHSKLDDVGVAPTETDATALLADSQLAENLEHKHVTKRSATTKLSSTTVAPTSGAPVEASVGSGNATSNVTAAANSTVEEKCEPKVLDEVPPEPFFDFSDIAEDAARQFTEFIANKFGSAGPPSQQAITSGLREELRRRANGIASYALNEDENLLAFAIAAPSIQTVVVKFRDDVTIPPDQVHNKAFLGSYWRELGVAWNSTEGTQEWGAPFRDCNVLKGRWLWPFRITFTENKLKIGAAAFIAADEDVCNDGLEEVFGRKHGCDRNTTFCLLTENKPAATRDVYTCICRESFYLPNSTLQGFRGDIVEASEGYSNYSCIPCPDGCTTCDQHGVCLLGEPPEVVSMESLLNVSVGSILGACMLCCIVLSVIVFRQRKCKAIASGMWTVLETILLGIILLYASVAVHFFPATTERCLLEPWLRELGFITSYGAIILKLYRHLVDFRTRKAHRWVLRDIDLLKYLGTMVFAVTCYMAAFTAAALDLIEVSQLGSLREQRTNTCRPLKWEYVTQVSEVLILCFGLHLAFASRNANTQFRDRQFLVAALAIEFLVSTTFYVLRFFYLPEMSPSAIFLALFLRSLLTNTMALGLIFVPKLWYQHKQVPLPMNLSIRLPVDAFKVNDPQRLGGGYAGLCLGDPDIGELTIAEMSPEDIRAELKRLYTQLEILKNKSLRQDNPHISKRRGGRKAGHRRFSLQKKGSKDKALSAKHRSNKHHQDIEITEAEPSRTPEDSVCSVEGPTDAEISGISHSMLSHSAISHSIISHSK
ncbi:PREDICTED: uncharacterized protein LOC108374738 isoform X3 [Rhagoletis zephyria]|uniref:uncharacterized protein LOC108374738 isoform X3 n=1 Tax=Rhagoletis zephyria TaxID=28612 RepID=UPI0008115066|nr:PREDICTED: uncharacterized protein LOC108374738 isoform X3 [Rhagoletis zephyria]